MIQPLNEKSILKNSKYSVVKDVKIYIVGLKKTCLGVLKYEEENVTKTMKQV